MRLAAAARPMSCARRLVREVAERGNLGRPVHGTELGGLRERDRRRLHGVHRSRVRVEGELQGLECELAGGTRQRHELRSAAEEARRAAFVGGDVRFFVAVNRAVGGRERREAQDVGGGAGRDRKGAHLGPEESAEHRIEALRPWIVAVGDREPLVGLDDRRQDLGAGRGAVVTAATYAVSYSMRQRKDQAPKARNASAVAARYSRFGAICGRPAPSSITARAASSTWVSGKTCATHCTQGGDPSSENQIPDSSIIGQVSTLSSPPTSSSLEKRAAIVSARAIIERAPSTPTRASNSRLPAL